MVITLSISNDRIVSSDQHIIGKINENKSTILSINVDSLLGDKDLYLEFEKSNGEKYVSKPLELNIKEDGTYNATFEMVNSLLDSKGELKCEVVLRNDDNYVFKSYTYKFYVMDSINASETLQEENPDFISEAKKTLDEMKNIVDTSGDGTKYLANDGQYKTVIGGTSDYNVLENKPIEVIESTDKNNPVILKSLQSGAYMLHGYFKAYEGAPKSIIAQIPLVAYVATTSTTSYIQLFFAYNNQIQYYAITENDYDSQSVSISDLVSRIEALESKVV